LKTVGVICLPIDFTNSHVGSNLKIIGWGRSEPGNTNTRLKFGKVQAFENSVIFKKYSGS
jgi:hypothetical protein